MLESLILKFTQGCADGRGMLKALQNDNLPELDLLVREAIQNSSDASLSQQACFFGVNFNYGTFKPTELNTNFPEIESILNSRYSEGTADYLEIRDYMTSGLTGEVRTAKIDTRDHGNYYKLVFDTGVEQTNSEGGMAGGSWGYGKSVYFRVGIGLVIFYSRIATENGYESRLIATLVENNFSEDAILNEVSPKAIGRAWWGKRDQSDPSELLPVTNENEIEELLDIFGVKPFDDEETGTAILIPYIDKEKLLDGIFPEHCGISDDVISMCTFKDDIVQYTQLAVQKWYAPKIQNRNLIKYSNQKELAVRVNETPIRFQDMRPLFQLVQELYTSALSANHDGTQSYHSTIFEGIRCADIPSNKIVGNSAGHIATVIVNNSAFSSTASVIPPQAYLRLFESITQNDPITMYARAAGMVLDYKIDGKWTKGISKPESDDDYMLSFFVPDCGLSLKDDDKLGKYAGTSFGEYLKKCEKSDHMDWNDELSMTIVTNITRQVAPKINACYKSADGDDADGTTSKLSGRLGRRLLPTKNYGKKKGGSGGSGGGSGSGGAINNFEFKVVGSSIKDRTNAIEFEMTFKNIRKESFVGIFTESEVGLMDAKAWEEGIKTKFPISVDAVRNCSTYAVNSEKNQTFVNDCTPENPTIENEYTTIELVYTEAGNVRGIRVKNQINNAVVKGCIVLQSSDNKYVCTVKEAKE